MVPLHVSDSSLSQEGIEHLSILFEDVVELFVFFESGF